MARKMRDSGVEWIGEVPEGWEIVPSGCFFSEVKEKNVEGMFKKQLSFKYGEIVDKTGNDATKEAEEEVATAYRIVTPDTIMINGLNLNYDLISQRVAIVKETGIITSAYLAVKGSEKMFPKFSVYLFKGYDSKQVFHSYGSGIRKTLKYSDFKDIPSIVPPLPEQRRIADYLDEKCAAIDGAVGELKRGIEDCKAWKKAIIFEAVTGKANVLAAKNAMVAKRQMRDSGIPWIGEIPEGWEVSRVKNECINFDSLREPISAENRENKQGLYDYYGASGVIDKIDDYNVEDTVLLIGEDGANLRMRNLPLVYKATGKFWVNNHAHILKPKEGRDYDFMAYALEAGDYNDFITGSAQPKLSQANLMAYPIALPPLPEQQAIANYLDEKCAAIDALVAEKEKLIADLETYKKSLIFELVTGKREVA